MRRGRPPGQEKRPVCDLSGTYINLNVCPLTGRRQLLPNDLSAKRSNTSRECSNRRATAQLEDLSIYKRLSDNSPLTREIEVPSGLSTVQRKSIDFRKTNNSMLAHFIRASVQYSTRRPARPGHYISYNKLLHIPAENKITIHLYLYYKK